MNTRAGISGKQAAIPAKHKAGSGLMAASAMLALAFTASGCNQLKARDLLNKGVAAFQNAHYDTAIEDFKEAKAADPGLLNARLYLAKAYATEYIPGAPSDENIRVGQQAINEFQDVLAHDPGNIEALDSIGSLLYHMADTPFSPDKFKESKTYYQKHIGLKPQDAEPYFRVGLIDWNLAYRANAEMRHQYNMQNPKKQIKDADPLPENLRAMFSQEYVPTVDEGLQMLDKAVSLNPGFDNAMAYQSLLLRQKADESDSATRASLEKQADALLDKVKEIKQQAADVPPKS